MKISEKPYQLTNTEKGSMAMDKNIQSDLNIKNFDSLAWRVMNVKEQQEKARKRLAYNLRPRLRRDEGETLQ